MGASGRNRLIRVLVAAGIGRPAACFTRSAASPGSDAILMTEDQDGQNLLIQFNGMASITE